MRAFLLHLLAGLIGFWVSMQEIWEYKEIKECFCPPHISPQGLPGLNIWWLLFLSPPTGTAKSLPFPHVYGQETQVCSSTVNPKSTLQRDVLFPLFQLLVSQPLLQGMWVKAAEKGEAAKLPQHQEESSCSSEWAGVHTPPSCACHILLKSLLGEDSPARHRICFQKL